MVRKVGKAAHGNAQVTPEDRSERSSSQDWLYEVMLDVFLDTYNSPRD